jgi:hypothetical protein
MIIDVIADSEKGAYEYHYRDYYAVVEHDSNKKTLTCKSPLQVLDFTCVSLEKIDSYGITLKGLTVVASGTGIAPESRIIRITFR